MSVFKLFHRGRFPKLPTFRPLACRVPNHEGSLTHHCEPAPACAAWSLGALRWLASWPEHPLRVVPSLLIGGAQLIEPTDGRKRTSATLDARFLVFMFLFFSFPESNQAWYQLSASRTCRSSRLSEPLEHLSALSSKSAQSPLAGCHGGMSLQDLSIALQVRPWPPFACFRPRGQPLSLPASLATGNHSLALKARFLCLRPDDHAHVQISSQI